MPDLLKGVDNWFLVLAVSVLGWYFVWSNARTLRGIDKNQSILFDLLSKLRSEFDTLKGEHNASHRNEHRKEY